MRKMEWENYVKTVICLRAESIFKFTGTTDSFLHVFSSFGYHAILNTSCSFASTSKNI